MSKYKDIQDENLVKLHTFYKNNKNRVIDIYDKEKVVYKRGILHITLQENEIKVFYVPEEKLNSSMKNKLNENYQENIYYIYIFTNENGIILEDTVD